MGKEKVRRKWNRLEQSATGHAKRIGLFLLFGGSGALRKWVVSSARTGKWVMDYRPVSRRYYLPSGKMGVVPTCHDMLELADRIAHGEDCDPSSRERVAVPAEAV